MKVPHGVVLLFLMSLVGCSNSEPIQEIRAADSGAPEAAAVAIAPTADWPWWRGPNRDGKAVDATPPTEWSSMENILWKADVPGRGHSTPSVCGDRIFVTSADEQKQIQWLYCYDRATGRRIWETKIHEGNFEHMHEKNSQASCTPACDGERVFTAFLNNKGVHVTAVDFDGRILWQKEAGPFYTVHGYAASPVIYKSFVIVAGDNVETGFLAALHRETGEIVWRVPRTNETSFCSPIVAHVAGRDQLLLSGFEQITSYNPENGELIWMARGTADTTAGTLIADDEHVYASGGYPQAQTLCIRADGSGDVTDTHIVWKNREKAYVPSLVLHDGLLFEINDGGIGLCFEAATGKQLWKSRLGGGFSASPIYANGLLYVPNEEGNLFVIRASRDFEIVAQNHLHDGGFASPVILGDRIYLRTNHHLYCIGNPAAQE